MAKVKLKFPNGFLWGAASSAYQTEGNNVNADWWPWENSFQRLEYTKHRDHKPENYLSGVACDHYNRYEEDFTLAEHLNHNTHRLGIEWSRVEPKEGQFNETELDHYEKVLQSAKFHKFTVFLTLHHFTCPVWFIKKGGFENKQNVDYFVSYAKKIANRLGQYVDFWLTINEPEVYSTYPFLLGVFPPQKRNLLASYRVLNNLILAHNTTAPILKSITGKPVSLAYHLSDLQETNFFAKPITTISHYLANEYILRRTINNSDYIGVNYYNHHHLGFFGPRKNSNSHHPVNDLGWGIHPEAFERVLMNVKKYNKPIYITENGLADSKDTMREKFIKDHLYYVHRAIKQGADIRSYLYWSLTDNFEWQHGFWPRFGLIEIDREDLLRRKVRYSATKFAEICKNNEFEYELPNHQ